MPLLLWMSWNYSVKLVNKITNAFGAEQVNTLCTYRSNKSLVYCSVRYPSIQSPYLLTINESWNRFWGIDSASLCSLAGRYDKKGCRTGPPGRESIPGLLERFTSTGSGPYLLGPCWRGWGTWFDPPYSPWTVPKAIQTQPDNRTKPN